MSRNQPGEEELGAGYAGQDMPGRRTCLCKSLVVKESMLPSRSVNWFDVVKA